MRRLLVVAKKRELIEAVPEIEWLKAPKPEFDFLTFDEAARLVAAADTEWSCMIILALKAGLRQGELLALRREDIDFVTGLLRVRRSVTRGIVTEPKSGKGRDIPLGDEAIAALKAERHLRGPLVFCDAAGRMGMLFAPTHRSNSVTIAEDLPILWRCVDTDPTASKKRHNSSAEALVSARKPMDPENALDDPGHVSKLGIEWSEWEAVRPRLQDFNELEVLRIRNVRVDQFPAIVYDLPGLKTLVLNGGQIGQFPIGISRMKQLRSIRVVRTAIPALPADLGKVPALKTVEVDSTAFRAFSLEKSDYGALEELGLSRCELAALPDEVSRLAGLRSLTVSGNRSLTQIPSSLATAKNLEFLYADDCGLERIPDELFSLPALSKIDLTGNTFPQDNYKALERLAKSHPKIEVLMPRSAAKKPAPGAVISEEPLAKSIQNDLDRLGALMDKSRDRREVNIAGTKWPVPPALVELLARIGSPRKIRVPVSGDPEPVVLGDFSGLDEYECTHHHPYVEIADTEFHRFVLVRLDDETPGDPMLYLLDSDEFQAHEANELTRLSAWLKAAHPANE